VGETKLSVFFDFVVVDERSFFIGMDCDDGTAMLLSLVSLQYNIVAG
jgi:hypothetical protein